MKRLASKYYIPGLIVAMAAFGMQVTVYLQEALAMKSPAGKNLKLIANEDGPACSEAKEKSNEVYFVGCGGFF